MVELKLNNNDGGQRLDKYLTKALCGIPVPLMYKYIRKKRVKVNGKRAKENLIVNAGDTVQLYIPDEFLKNSAGNCEFDRINVNLDVVYEDGNIIICSKKPGVLSHTGDKGENGAAAIPERDTLIFMIRAYLFQKGEYDPTAETTFSPALCNRIDRNTGGIVIAAKNALSLREMNRLISENLVDKRYLCAVHGKMNPKECRLSAYLFKNSKTKTVYVSNDMRRGAKKIVTDYKTLDYNKSLNLSLLEVHLETGRTHQIRAHMAFAGHPLLGEGKYAENREDRKLGYKYQALFSYKVGFLPSDGCLSYLSGKSFQVDLENIGFLKLFEGSK